MACPVGTYKPQTDSSACIPCDPGQSTPAEGSQSAAACIAVCGNGSYSPTGLVPCLPCPPGTYQDEPAQRACKYCPRGTNSTAFGLVRADDCCAGCWADTGRAAGPPRRSIWSAAVAAALGLALTRIPGLRL